MDSASCFTPFGIFKNNLLFTIWVMFWNIDRIYFIFFCMQTLRTIVSFLFFSFFPMVFFSWKFIPYQFYSFIKGLIFVILGGSFLISSWFNATVTSYSKHLSSFLLIRFIVAFFVVYPIRRIYIWSSTIHTYFIRL